MQLIHYVLSLIENTLDPNQGILFRVIIQRLHASFTSSWENKNNEKTSFLNHVKDEENEPSISMVSCL